MAKAARYVELIRFALGSQNELSKESLDDLVDNGELDIYAEILTNRILNDKEISGWENSMLHFKKLLNWDHLRRGEKSNELLPEEEEKKPEEFEPVVEIHEEKPEIIQTEKPLRQEKPELTDFEKRLERGIYEM